MSRLCDPRLSYMNDVPAAFYKMLCCNDGITAIIYLSSILLGSILIRIKLKFALLHQSHFRSRRIKFLVQLPIDTVH